MTEMEERVARALFEADGFRGWQQATGRGHYMRAARAAIKAMREPTAGMLLSFDAVSGFLDIEAWRTAIDAALTPAAPDELPLQGGANPERPKFEHRWEREDG